ncbi:major histocompatibility complex class I-related gene protein-like [Astatotilapia calliptera]|uniref:Ig-like domain-containing protein n=1 Tax=Astatotilapia calliptera TaxID=8154 RepID=A0A3P8QGF7_ASTCA|nr:major histocompatibility complex class I-related gene protein-like [Astatotilapia calliptera]
MVAKLMILFLLCHAASAVSHMLKYFGTGTSGNPDIAEFMFVLEVDDTEVLYCDASKKIVEPRQDGVKKMLDDNPGALGEYTQECFEHQPGIYQNSISNLKQLLNQSGGVHILQCMIGSEMNENSGEVKGFLQLGYNGEGYLEFDLKTMTWIPLKPEFNIVKQTMDGDRNLINYLGNLFGTIFLERLKMFLDYGSSSLNKTVLPSVSLLQKTPSSPVSCHATGFYPDRAAIFWRKDGVEIHEGVDPGEILPNNDETFQMNVDLNISSVTPEDWRRYDCVFQLSGVSEDIIIKLNKTIIKTNLVNNKTHIDAELPIIIAAFVLVLIIIVAIGIVAYKKKKESHPSPSPSIIIELNGRSGTESPDSAQRSGTESPDSAQRLATESPVSAQKLATESPDSAQRSGTESPDSAQRSGTESPDSAQS